MPLNPKKTMSAGDAKIIRYTIVDENKQLVPMSVLNSGQFITWRLSKNAKSVGPDIYVTKTKAAGQIAVVADGKVEVTLVEADTDGLTPGIKYNELEFVDSTGRPSTAAWGPFEILPTVIRAPRS